MFNIIHCFQTTTSHMYVHWDSFVDVEELGHAHHGSGIEYYTLAIGNIFIE